jgi:transcriptional regulator with XRE-family HTH domain
MPSTRQQYYNIAVGQLVLVLREKHGWSQLWLARELDCPQSTISRIEQGRSRLGIMTFGKFAGLCQKPTTELHAYIELAMLRAGEMFCSVLGPAEGEEWWETLLRISGPRGLGMLLGFATLLVVEEQLA